MKSLFQQKLDTDPRLARKSAGIVKKYREAARKEVYACIRSEQPTPRDFSVTPNALPLNSL